MDAVDPPPYRLPPSLPPCLLSTQFMSLFLFLSLSRSSFSEDRVIRFSASCLCKSFFRTCLLRTCCPASAFFSLDSFSLCSSNRLLFRPGLPDFRPGLPDFRAATPSGPSSSSVPRVDASAGGRRFPSIPPRYEYRYSILTSPLTWGRANWFADPAVVGDLVVR